MLIYSSCLFISAYIVTYCNSCLFIGSHSFVIAGSCLYMLVTGECIGIILPTRRSLLLHLTSLVMELNPLQQKVAKSQCNLLNQFQLPIGAMVQLSCGTINLGCQRTAEGLTTGSN